MLLLVEAPLATTVAKVSASLVRYLPSRSTVTALSPVLFSVRTPSPVLKEADVT